MIWCCGLLFLREVGNRGVQGVGVLGLGMWLLA